MTLIGSFILAQLDEPLRLLTEPPTPAATTPLWLIVLVVAASVLALGSTIAAMLMWRHRKIQADPAGHAFGALTRQLRASGAEKRALRALALERGIEPVALLVSPSALAAAIAASETETGLAVGSLRAALGRFLEEPRAVVEAA